MITFPKYLDRTSKPVIRLVGLGNAGVNLADRMTMGAGLPMEVVAINSDMQSLSSSVAPVKVALGPLTTRGLGAGGDPEIGYDAAKESITEIEDALAGSDIVFLCAGLGGGTASGAAGMLAQHVKQTGALLIAVVTSPFAFEGRRRSSQATVALREVEAYADAVVHFENDRMAELAAPRAGVSETFSVCDELLGGCVGALARLIAAPGPLAVGLPDLLSVLNSSQGRCLFGTGGSKSENRAHEALEKALKSPLLDRGTLLDEAGSLLVHISGPPGLSFAEVGAIMQEAARQASESTLLHHGVSTSADPASPVVVTLLGKCGCVDARAAFQVPAVRQERFVQPSPAAPEKAVQQEEFISTPGESTTKPPPAEIASPLPQRPQKPTQKTAAQKIKQETLQFEPVARGRFEKIEPTIVEGEDLDIPTFLRLNKKG